MRFTTMHYDLFCSTRKCVDVSLLNNFYLVKETEADNINFVYPTTDKPIKVNMRKLSKIDLEKEAEKNRALFGAMEGKCLYEKDIAEWEQDTAASFLQEINSVFFNNAVVNLPAHDVMYAVVHALKPIPLGHVVVSISGEHCLSISSGELYISVEKKPTDV